VILLPTGAPIDRLWVELGLNAAPYAKGWRDAGAVTKREQAKLGTQVDTWGKGLGQKGQAAGKQYGAGLGVGLSSATKEAAKALGGIMALAGGVTLLGTAFAGVKMAASFEYEMSRIKAVSGSTAERLVPLRAQIIQLGKDTVFSAGQTATAATELIKAGVSVSETQAALEGVLALASAGELDVARAAEIASNAMNVFGIAGKDIMTVADALASAANASSLEVEDLAGSLQYIGPVASQLRMPVQQIVAALAELGNVGIKGEMAGTGLRGMLSSLMSPSKVARGELDKLNVSLSDSAGAIVPLPDLLDQFNRGLEGMTEGAKMEALGKIFDTQQLGAAMVLIKGGSQALGEWTEKVSVAGEAQRVSAEKMDNLRGSWEQLKGSIETLAISEGSPLMKDIRGLVDAMTGLVNGFMSLPEPVQTSIERLALFTAGAVALGWGLRALQPVLAQTSAMIRGTGAAATTAAAGLATAEAATVTWVATAGGGLLAQITAAAPAAGAAAGASWATGFAAAARAAIPLVGIGLAFGSAKDTRWSALSEENQRLIAQRGKSDAERAAADRAVAEAKNRVMQLSLSVSDGFVKEAKAAESVTVATKLLADQEAATAEQTRALDEHVKAVTANLSGLLSPMGAATEATALAKTAATEHATALGLSAQATADYVEKAGASLGTFMDILQKQKDAQDQLIRNMRTIVDRLVASGVDPATIKTIIDQVGQLPADIVDKYADAGKPEFDRMTGLMEKVGERSAQAFDEGVTKDLDQRIQDQSSKYVKLWDGSVIPKLETSGEDGAVAYVDAFGNYVGLQLPSTITGAADADLGPSGAAAALSFKTGFDNYLRAHKLALDAYGNVVMGPAGGASAAELFAALNYQQAKSGGGLAGTTRGVQNAIFGRFPGAIDMGGRASSGHIKNSDHYTGHAFDVGGSWSTMQGIATLLARSFGSMPLKYIIFNRQIDTGSGWRPYHGTSPHTDHVHVSTYDAGGVLPPGLTLATNYTGGNEVVLPAGWIDSLTSDVTQLVNEIRRLVNADDEIAKGLKGITANERILTAFSDRSALAGSYVSREQARLSMQQATGADLATQTSTLMRQIEFIDKAIAEAQLQLDTAKARGMDPAEINRLAGDLYGLQESAANARRELQELARTPLEDAARRWSNSLAMLNDQIDLLGNSSNASALLKGLLPQQLGLMGGQYQTTLDLMGAPGQTPDQIMSLGQQASSQVMGMFDASKTVLAAQLSDTMASIDASERAWLSQWDARSSALEAQLSREEQALSDHYAKEREQNQKRVDDLRKSQDAALKALTKGYNDRLTAMQDGERAITRAEEQARAQKALGKTEDELRILQGQGFYTEADIARMRELETLAQEQRDGMAQQQAAWAREDARTALERERDAAIERLQLEQESAMELLQAQVAAADERLAQQERAAQERIQAQRAAFEEERRLAEEAFQRQRDAAQAAYQAEVDALVAKYSAMLQEVQDQQTALLGQSDIYRSAGYQLGASLAQGVLDSLPLIEAAGLAAADALSRYLELHSPAKEGPLSRLDEWFTAFVPTILRPLDLSQLVQPVMDTFGPATIRQERTSRFDEHIWLHGDPGTDQQTLDKLAEKMSDLLNHRVRIASQDYGS